MKTTLLVFCVFGSLALGQDYSKRTELTQDSILRVELLKDLRARIDTKSSRRDAVRAEGEMQVLKNWAFFKGSKVTSEKKDALASSHTAALFMKNRDGWVIVDYTTDFKDEVFSQWVEKYTLSQNLFPVKAKTP